MEFLPRFEPGVPALGEVQILCDKKNHHGQHHEHHEHFRITVNKEEMTHVYRPNWHYHLTRLRIKSVHVV